MSKFSRRQFVGGLAAGAASMLLPVRSVLGANETINMGFIGVGGRGAHSAKWFGDLKDVRVTALCDADTKVMGGVAKKFPDAKAYQDLRKLLDDKNIDAVCISTCNHWHALAAIWAMQAGKDVYVEKPVSQTVWEGRQMTLAARKFKRICQGGTQQRSDKVQDEIKAFLASGKIGAMQWVRGNRYGVRKTIGKLSEPLKPPAEVNYDLWLGPAQDLPMFRKDFHYDWHWIWNTGSGEMGNWGVHILDDIRNILGDKCGIPKQVLAGGSRVLWNDAGETPNVHFVYFDTGVVPVIFSLSNIPFSKERATASPHYRNIQSGYIVQCEGGYYAGGRGGGWAYDKEGKKLQQFKGDGGGAHARNFIDAVKSRDASKQNAEIEQNHYSASWCHFANIAYRLGAAYSRDQVEAAAKGFAPWGELLTGFHAHLEANGVDASKADLKASVMLDIDPQKETFVGASATPQALSLLTREYRKPYVIPDLA